MAVNILIVLPYSGNQFGGGLAVLNQKLIRALAGLGHRVKLVTMDLPDELMPVPAEHPKTEIIAIPHAKTKGMKDAGGPKGEKDRNLLYELINHPKIILDPAVLEQIKKGNFYPDIIIGHSRFSGPAAIQLRDVFPKARVEYFLHSFPVEGSALVGYGAYEEASVGPEVAAQKMKDEGEWMPRADVVVGMGPLITAGALLILQNERKQNPRVHEAISGIELKKSEPVGYRKRVVPELLLCGRGSAPIKGLEDLLLAVRMLWDNKCPVHVDVLWWADREYSNSEPRTFGNDVDKVTGGKGQWVNPGKRELEEFRSVEDPSIERVAFNTRNVDLPSAQTWIDEMMGIAQIKEQLGALKLERLVTLLSSRSGDAVDETYRAHDATLMPSYIEHFGLVPFESLSHGIPVLCNQVSGAGMFLGDPERFPSAGPPCVVPDFKGSMANPRDYLVDVPIRAFDKRPVEWAKAIETLVNELPARYADAGKLLAALKSYTYDEFAASIVDAAHAKFDRCITKQGAKGAVMVVR